MPKKASRDVAAEITALIVKKLEEGVPPWSRPWSVSGAGGRPLRHCGTAYSGINSLYLWAIADTRGYRSRNWMTYRQAAELGGQVRRGETGSLSVYFSTFAKTETDRATGDEVRKTVRFLRSYIVFSADQIDGLPAHFYPAPVELLPPTPSEHQAAIDAFFARLPLDVRHGGDSAFFNRAFDYIQMPPAAAFRTMDHYASTLAHETVHWTGHEHRLARTFGKRFGDAAYSFEELVAEIGSGLICADLGLPNALHESHASYVDHWLRILRADKTAIIHAAAKAEQALAYLRGFDAGIADAPDDTPDDASGAAVEHRLAA